MVNYTLKQKISDDISGSNNNISLSGNFLAVGDNNSFPSNPGVVNIYQLENNEFKFKQKLSDNDSGTINNRFGYSLDLSNNFLVVGDTNSDSSGNGAVSIYQIENGEFKFKQKLSDNSSGSGNNSFGWSVALSDNFLVIGDTNSDSSGNGSVSIYQIENGEFKFKQKLSDNDSGSSNNSFGWSVALSGNILAVGDVSSNSNNHGAVSIYNLEKDEFKLKQKLSDNDSGSSNNDFGWSVALSGNILAVGDISSNSNNHGAISIYNLEKDEFKLKQKLNDNKSGSSNNSFGWSVEISENILAVGDISSDSNNHGAVSIYKLKKGLFKLKQKLSDNSSGSGNNDFGYSISLLGNILAIGDITSESSGQGVVSIYQA